MTTSWVHAARVTTHDHTPTRLRRGLCQNFYGVYPVARRALLKLPCSQNCNVCETMDVPKYRRRSRWTICRRVLHSLVQRLPGETIPSVIHRENTEDSIPVTRWSLYNRFHGPWSFSNSGSTSWVSIALIPIAPVVILRKQG